MGMNKTTEALKYDILVLKIAARFLHKAVSAKERCDYWIVKELIAKKEMQLAEPVKQEPVMDYERINALREGEQNGAEDAYFFVRPENDTPTSRKMFCQGFERGFHKGLEYAAPVDAKAIRAEALEEAAKWCEAKQSYNAMHANTEFAAAIRGLK